MKDIECTYGHATTVHKMQGSEHPVVVIIAHSSHQHMLNKNLLYTAITRASKQVVILGNLRGIEYCLREDKFRQNKLAIMIKQANK